LVTLAKSTRAAGASRANADRNELRADGFPVGARSSDFVMRLSRQVAVTRTCNGQILCLALWRGVDVTETILGFCYWLHASRILLPWIVHQSADRAHR